jgi:hypothetical protein
MALQGTANGHAGYPPASQQLPWLPSVSGAPGGAAAASLYPAAALPPPQQQQAAAAGQLPGAYEAQLVAHIMTYINNLWRVDPGNFEGTLNLICAQAPSLMQRLVERQEANRGGARGGGGGGGEGEPPAALSELQSPQEFEARARCLLFR